MSLGMSPATVLDRIKKLEAAGIVTGYTVRLDHEKMGYTLTAVVEAAVEKPAAREAAGRLASLERVCCVYDVTGETDVVVVGKFRGREDLDRFVKDLARVPGVTRTVTRLVLNTSKEDYGLI